MVEVSGGPVRGSPRLGWVDDIKMALGSRGMTVEAVRQCMKDMKKWRALVHVAPQGGSGWIIGCYVRYVIHSLLQGVTTPEEGDSPSYS